MSKFVQIFVLQNQNLSKFWFFHIKISEKIVFFYVEMVHF